MTLFVFALNTPVSVTLTDLTRAQGLSAGLPPLGDWLGLTALDTDRIELFAVADLGDMPLSGYLSTAHDAEIGDHASKLDALEGSVLLAPEAAMTGAPDPGPEATLIATLKTAKADHSARLDPAPIPQPTPAPQPEEPASSQPLGWIVAVALALVVILVWWAS